VNADDLRGYLRTAPFEPFEIRLSNGRVYTIEHPEFMALAPDGRTVACYTDDSRLVTVAIQHINSIEKVNRPNAA
jgi:hypothetical protein